jgi:hypothetical protein
LTAAQGPADPQIVKWVVVVCLLAGVARADTEADRVEAARLFEEGRRLKEAGDLDAACVEFDRSYQLETAAGTALNLGECYEREGRWKLALEFYWGAAKFFDKAGRAESAKFAREKADAVLEAHPVEKPEPPPKRAPTTGRTTAKVVAIAGFSIAALAGVTWAISYNTIQEFRNTRIDTVTPFQPKVTPDDCGKGLILSPMSAQSKFGEACTANARIRWAMPTMFISGALGIGALLYLKLTPRNTAVAVVPASGGATVAATFEW